MLHTHVLWANTVTLCIHTLEHSAGLLQWIAQLDPIVGATGAQHVHSSAVFKGLYIRGFSWSTSSLFADETSTKFLKV
jgi:hypothetical protein